MKKAYKTIGLFALFIISFSCAATAQQANGYEITGHFAGLKDGDKVIMNMMVYQAGISNEVTTDSAFVKNGTFQVKGVVPNGPRVYWLRASGIPYRMYIDNGERITLTLNQNIRTIKSSLLDDYVTCTGSPANYASRLIQKLGDGYDANTGIALQLNKVRQSQGYNKEVVEALIAAKKRGRESFNFRFLEKIGQDIMPAAPFLVLYELDHDPVWDGVYNQFDEHLRNSLAGQQLKAALPLLEGKEMPGFSLPDVSGKIVQLKDITSKSKVTLVHFWATNSVKRKAFDDELRAMYKLYHDKGLNIVAVATESFEEQWKETLAKENYPWLNVFDKRGQKVVDPVYHELGEVDHQNTTNVLLDPNGKIVAWDPSGIELQYYILKTLGE